MRSLLMIILMVVVCAFSLLFFAQNNQAVLLSYFIGESEIPLSFIMLASLLLGVLLGLIVMSSSLFKYKFQARQFERKLKQKKQELENLRSLPLRDDY
ncbi:MAG: LapA family protein [Gammaproteobacteria bacterium]|nr:LapA family protein [Gammaproteobacteria bacterium]NVK88451.1 LapA family protein [Gammaproteobacteria bacterium]